MKRCLSILLALSLMLSLMFGAQSVVAEQNSFIPGTYEGTASGNNGAIVVKVTVDDTKITNIEIVSHSESAGISDIAFERIPSSILENQSLAVDAVATATNSSNGIIAAVRDALEKNGMDVSNLLVPLEKSEKQGETIEKTADVIIIGGGGAGLAAAASATEAGASVILIEKTPTLGGNTAISGGGYNTADEDRQKNSPMKDSALNAVKALLEREPHDDFEKALQETVSQQLEAHLAGENAQTLFDSPEFHMLQTYNGGDYKGTPEMIRTLCENSLNSIHWLEGMGMEFADTVKTITGGLYDRGHSPIAPLGTGYIDTLAAQAKKNGAEIIMEARATELITKDGRVTGVKAECSNGDILMLTANKGVVMATGGFSANVELREKVNTQWPTLDASIPTTNTPAIVGDGLFMAEDVGANLINLEDIQLLPLGDPKTGSLKGKIGKIPSDFIFVNLEGKRFVAEDARLDVMSKALLEQTNSYMYIIDDGDSYPTADTPTNFEVTVGDMVKQGTVFMDDTVEGLAQQIGIDAATLQETIDTYNACVDAQKDDVTGKKTFTNKIDKAPYYACPRVPTVHHTMGGIQIDTQTRVLNAQGEIIPGFFAAGEVTGGIHGTNRLGGNAIADAITFGRIAGQMAAQ